jgi:hypothetical protein
MPFEERGAGVEPYFSDGVTEDVIADLGRFSGLFVLSWSAVAPFREERLALDVLKRRLGVRYIVNGTVQRTGDRLRVNVQLTDADRGVLVWSERYRARPRIAGPTRPPAPSSAPPTEKTRPAPCGTARAREYRRLVPFPELRLPLPAYSDAVYAAIDGQGVVPIAIPRGASLRSSIAERTSRSSIAERTSSVSRRLRHGIRQAGPSSASNRFELFCLADDLGTHFLVRTCVDRLAGEGDHTIAAELNEVEPCGLHTVEVRHGKETVEVEVELKYHRLRVLPQIGKQKHYRA